jgi:DNA-binding LytR/AlgR family response regulator
MKKYLLYFCKVKENNPKRIYSMIFKNNFIHTNEPIYFPSNKAAQLIKPSSIVYLEADSNYTYIHCADGKKMLLSRTIKYLKAYLPEDKFIRIHQSYLVNIDYISTAEKTKITLRDNKCLPVSRRHGTLISKQILVLF